MKLLRGEGRFEVSFMLLFACLEGIVTGCREEIVSRGMEGNGIDCTSMNCMYVCVYKICSVSVCNVHAHVGYSECAY